MNNHRPLNTAKDELTAIEAEQPPGTCELCGAENVPVFTLEKVGEPELTMNLCLKCLTGQNNKQDPQTLN